MITTRNLFISSGRLARLKMCGNAFQDLLMLSEAMPSFVRQFVSILKALRLAASENDRRHRQSPQANGN